MNGNRGDILQLQVDLWRNGDAHVRQHAFHAADRERSLRGLIAAAIQADHQAITDQLIAANSGDHG
jgi:hypothetical protein